MELQESKALLVAEFIEEQWSDFTQFLDERGEDEDLGEEIINQLKDY
jgi:hypothetical protein